MGKQLAEVVCVRQAIVMVIMSIEVIMINGSVIISGSCQQCQHRAQPKINERLETATRQEGQQW